MLIKEKVVDETYVNVMGGEVVRLGDMLVLFNKGGGINGMKYLPLFYLREIT